MVKLKCQKGSFDRMVERDKSVSIYYHRVSEWETSL